MTTRMVDMVGRRYVLDKKLGAGGMGAVYEAFDRLSGETVALKRVTSVHNDDHAVRIALSREFQTLASLRHPNVIGVLDYGFDDERMPYFTMRLLQKAHPLNEAGRGKSAREKLRFISQVLQALVYLHRRGVLHRDLKPDNVLLAEDGLVKVLDFGLATGGGQRGPEHGGTLRYMAPEVVRGETPDERADLYSVGVITYELLTNNHPFQGTNTLELVKNILNSEPNLLVLEEIVLEDSSSEPVLSDDQPTWPVFDLQGEMPTMIGDPLPEDPENTEMLNIKRISDELEAVSMQHTFIQQEGFFTTTGDVGVPTLSSFVGRLLDKEAEHRFPSAQAALDALHALLGDVATDTHGIRDSFLQAAQFVGRETELKSLKAALGDAIEGRGSLWLVAGESGVGKSRLSDEIRTQALVQGVMVLRGQAVHEGSQTYQVWREPLRRLVMSANPSPNEASILKQIIPDIDRLINHEVTEVLPVEGADPQQRLQAAVVNVFTHYMQRTRQPILVLLEDLQWSDESLALLNALAGVVSTLPLLIIGNYRNDEAPDMVERVPNASMIQLSRLEADHISQLSRSMLGEAGRQPHLVEFLHKETEGNIFFIIEIVRALAEEAGHLERVAQMKLPQRVTAGGMQALLQRRLDQVAPPYRPLLAQAAVMGREIDLAALIQTARRVTMDDWLNACANAAVLEFQDGRWRFAHDKLRERIINALTPEQSKRLHQRAAEGIEAAYAWSLDDQAAMLAYHWSFTGNTEKEFNYSTIAGEKASDVSAYRDAKHYLERALVLAENFDKHELLAEKANAQVKLADVYQALGMYEQAIAQLDAALALARSLKEPRHTAMALLSLGWVNLRQGNMTLAKEMGSEALQFAREAQNRRLTIETLHLTGLINLIEGNYQASNYLLEESLPLARDMNDRHLLANILNAYGAVQEGLGNVALSDTTLREALVIAQEIDNRYLSANIQGNLGRMNYSQQAYDEARTYFETALTLFREVENGYGAAMALYYLGFIAIAQSRTEEAMPYLRDSMRMNLDIGAMTNILIALCGVARLYSLSGRHEAAVELLGMIMSHAASGSDVDVEKETVPLMNELSSQMSAEAFGVALERGTTFKLEQIVGDLVGTPPAEAV